GTAGNARGGARLPQQTTPNGPAQRAGGRGGGVPPRAGHPRAPPGLAYRHMGERALPADAPADQTPDPQPRQGALEALLEPPARLLEAQARVRVIIVEEECQSAGNAEQPERGPTTPTPPRHQNASPTLM